MLLLLRLKGTAVASKSAIPVADRCNHYSQHACGREKLEFAVDCD